MASPSQSRSSLLAAALVILQFFGLSMGLQVTPGSECASYCLDGPDDDPKNPSSSSTNSTDIVCINEEYWSTAKGTKYRACMDCLQSSTAVNGTESDVSWYLYNLRYTVDVCLFSYPHADEEKTSTSSPCVLEENCLPLRSALETGNLDPKNGSMYDYCSADSGSFMGTSFDNCVQCFRTAANQTYMTNFLTALSVGCEQQPTAGTLLSVSGTLFSSAALNYTGSSANQTATGTSSSDSTLATGAIVGIAIGAALLLASALLLFYLYWRSQKKQNLYYFPENPSSDRSRPAKSISSSVSGGYIPHYTIDYKRPPGIDHHRQYEMSDNIKTQLVVVSSSKLDNYIPGSATTGIWGRDTPKHKEQFVPSSQVKTPLAHQVVFDDSTLQGLDEMPTHPAFIPRIFARGSRNPSAFANEQRAPKVYKPDDFAAHQYLDSVDASTVDVQSLLAQPLPTAKSMNTVKSSTTLLSNNPFASANIASKYTPSPPGPPPSGSNGPALAPNVTMPSFSRLRSPKRYIPPPLNIEQARPKAQRVDGETAESGML